MNLHINIKKPTHLAGNLPLTDWFKELSKSLTQSNQRLLLNFQGERNWCVGLLPEAAPFNPRIVLSNQHDFSSAVPFSKADTLLGRESGCVVYDGFGGIHIDVLCMAAGLLKAGGVLMLLTPPNPEQMADVYGQWQGAKNEHNYFLQYLFQQLRQDMIVLRQSASAALPDLKQLPFSPLAAISDGTTREQRQLLLELAAWLQDRRIPLFFLTADRGRGKSTTLGLFARQQAQPINIVVTAASRSQAAVLLKQLDANQSNVQFIAPDEIIRRQIKMALLIIDEAAMLPNSMLQQCIALADKALLATTTGGYEGTGQGFLLKFKAAFESTEYIQRTLLEPVRWGQQDMLEKWINSVLMFEPVSVKATTLTATVSISALSRKQLNEDFATLKAVYGLLVSAHYRTRPSDLRQLMEDDNQQVLVAKSAQGIVGVLLLNREGGFDAPLCHDVFMGRRRPQGHLFAQMITAQAGIKNFACYQGYRVQRIAVDACCRRQGIGRLLIEASESKAREQRLDYLGSSFAIDHGVAAFWKSLGFSLLHIGSGRGKSSGRQTVAVIRPLTNGVKAIQLTLNKKLEAYLPVWLLAYCNNLYWRDVMAILDLLTIEYEFSAQDEDEITAFASGHRGLELTQGVLQRLLINRSSHINRLPQDTTRLLIERILLNKDWQALEGHAGQQGKKELLKRIRSGVLTLNQQRRSSGDE